MEKCLITRIVRDSILDGPGCRYTIFVKGCHLRCEWCHNPETQSLKQEILRYPKFCIKCGNCVKAIGGNPEKDVMPIIIDNTKAEMYYSCVDNCPTNALEYAGKEFSVSQLLDDMQKYRTVYNRTKGGLTISGGEPLLHENFSYNLFAKAKSAGFHTAVDTTAAFEWELLEKFLPVIDLWMIDIKHLYDSKLKSVLVLENLLKLSSIKDINIWIRVPLIPGYNDLDNLLKEMAEVIKKAGKAIKQVSILPFHPLGDAKYNALCRNYQFAKHDELNTEILNKTRNKFAEILKPVEVITGIRMIHG